MTGSQLSPPHGKSCGNDDDNNNNINNQNSSSSSNNNNDNTSITDLSSYSTDTGWMLGLWILAGKCSAGLTNAGDCLYHVRYNGMWCANAQQMTKQSCHSTNNIIYNVDWYTTSSSTMYCYQNVAVWVHGVCAVWVSLGRPAVNETIVRLQRLRCRVD